MRLLAVFLSALLLTVSAGGTAARDAEPRAVHVEPFFIAALVQDGLCGEGSGHGTCQLVPVDEMPGPILPFATEHAGFPIAPMAATGRSFAPQTPPPRSLS